MSRKSSLKTIIDDQIPKDKLKYLTRSFEIVGDIAICEIDNNLKEYEKIIGQGICELNKSIKTVLKKKGIHSGEFRTQELEYVYGEDKKETIYNENNVRLKINPEKVYFSARLSTEREELMKNIKENNKILVMFSGIGPYSFVALRKEVNLDFIVSIELNPIAHKYALENKQLNKSIIKKSKIYKELVSFLKENNLPIIDKLILKNLNNLIHIQINGDVKKEIEKFKKIQTDTEENNINDNDKLLNENSKKIFEILKDEDTKNLTFNVLKLDENSIKKLLYFFILFNEKINFKFIFENFSINASSNINKTLIYSYLKNPKQNILNIYKFDHIFMPLPKDAELFLEDAFKVVKEGTIIHMYDFLHEKEFPTKSEREIINRAKDKKIEVEIIKTRKVGQYSPRKFRTCTDFKIIKINK